MTVTDLYEMEKTPASFRMHLNRLRYNIGYPCLMFALIKEEKKIMLSELVKKMGKTSEHGHTVRLITEYLTVLKCLGAIDFNYPDEDTCQIIYVQDYSTEEIDDLLKNPQMFDMMLHMKPKN